MPVDRPVRWDALGSPATDEWRPDDFAAAFPPDPGTPAAFDDEIFGGAPVLDGPAWTDDDFGAEQFTPVAAGYLDEPTDPSPAPLFVPLGTPDAEPTLYDDAHRVCARLCGVTGIAHELASRAVRSEEDGTPDGTVYAVISSAVSLALAQSGIDRPEIPYRQHRARLRRELARHTERDRVILALRHLVGVPPVAVAARLGIQESLVREVGSAWRPADSRGDSSALLRGIDSWISSDLSRADVEPTGTELAHLDDCVDHLD